MTSQLNSIYWDTTVFLSFLRKHEVERRKICEDILYHARDGQVSLYTSTFTIIEVIRPSGARPLAPGEVAEVQAMFQWPWIKKVDLEQRVARKVVDVEREFGLSVADSIHAASAIIAQADVLQHWERKEEFAKVSRLIRVEQPRMLTYGGVRELPAPAEGMFRAATANSSPQIIRQRSRA
jgi:predicted nucleic acid-binding protein